MTEETHGTVGSSLDDFLIEEGILESVTAESMKRVIAWQVQQAMEDRMLNKTQMAELLGVKRAQLDRILDPENTGMTLKTLCETAGALGKNVSIVFEDRELA